MATLTTLLMAFALQAEGNGSGCDSNSPFPGMERVEVQANTFTSNRQVDPALAADTAGNVLTAWGSRRQELGSFGVFAQLVDARGRWLTAEIHVNETLPGYQGRPAVAFLDDGSAWIAWQSVTPNLDGCGIFARRFVWSTDAAGVRSFAPSGPEIALHAGLGDNPADVVLTATDTGWMAAWAVDAAEGTRQLLARHFDAAGAPAGESFRLGETGIRESLASLDRVPGGFVAVWSEADFAGQPTRLAGFLRTSDAARRFEIASARDGIHVEPCVSAAADGAFVVAFLSSQDGEHYRAAARRFDANADARGAAFIVDAGGTEVRNGALVATARDGGFVVAYNSIEPKLSLENGERPEVQGDVRAQRFAADGTPIGAGFRLTAQEIGRQTLMVGVNARHFLWTAQEQLVAAWEGMTGGSDKAGIGLTMLVPDALRPAAPVAIAPRAALVDADVFAVYADAQQAPPIHDPTFVAGPYVPPPPPAAGSAGGFQSNSNTGWYPPDPDCAVGPNHVVSVVNGEIGIWTKSGTKTFGQSLVGFWASVGAGGFVFDPVAYYDAASDRYIVAAADGAGSNDAICLAASDDSDPNGTWFKYRFTVSGTCNFLDFPNLGGNDQTIFLSGDCFSGGGNRIFMWDKAKILNGTATQATMKNLQANGSTQSLGNTKNYDADGVGYFCTTYSGSSTKLKIQAVRNANTSPTLSTYSLTVPSFSHPNDAVQQGTGNRADTIDFRIKNGVVRNNYLWVCHNNGNNGRSSVRWYQIDLNGWPNSGSNPTLVQSGDIDGGTGNYTWFGDINVTSTNDAVVVMNRSSSSQYISIDFAHRMASDANGTMQPLQRLQISTAPETGSRYGDYSGVEQDPDSDTLFWSAHEYVTSGWRVWIGMIELSDAVLDLTSTLLIHGQPVTFTIANCNPSETVTVFGSLAGGTYCPPGYGGLCLELGGNVRTVGTTNANGAGVATLTVTVPANFTGRTVQVQAAAIRGIAGADSVKSNLLTIVVG